MQNSGNIQFELLHGNHTRMGMPNARTNIEHVRDGCNPNSMVFSWKRAMIGKRQQCAITVKHMEIIKDDNQKEKHDERMSRN